MDIKKRAIGIFIAMIVASSVFAAVTMTASAQQVLYGATGGGGGSSLYTIDANTGVATLIGPISDGVTNFRVSGIAFDTNGTLYGAGHGGFIQIDPTTGAGTFIASISMPAGDTCSDISFAPDGTLYCYNCYSEADDGFGIIDPSTGAQTWIGWTNVSCCGNGMDVASYGTVYHGNEDGLHTINIGTGAATLLYGWTFPEGISDDPEVWYRPNAFDFDDSGTLYASLNGGSSGSGPTYLVTIDTSNGVMTLVGQTDNRLDALAFMSVPAPIPTLTPIGLIALAGLLSVIAAMSITLKRKRR